MAIDSTHMTSVYTVPSELFPPPADFHGEELQIFVGDGYAAADVEGLKSARIRGVLNVAYDLDDQPADDEHRQHLAPDPHRPAPPEDASGTVLQRYEQQFAKVGLIDGYGNVENDLTVIAAVLMAEQLFTFADTGTTPDPPLVNKYKRGNLLIHCWSGRSRSVTVAALYIWFKFGVELGDQTLISFADTYEQEKSLRGDSTSLVGAGAADHPDVSSNMTGPPPTYGMQAAASGIVDSYSAIFPTLKPATS